LSMRIVTALLLSGFGYWIASIAWQLAARQMGFIPCCIENAATWGTLEGFRNADVADHVFGLVSSITIGASFFSVCAIVTTRLSYAAALMWGAIVGVWVPTMAYPGGGILDVADAIAPFIGFTPDQNSTTASLIFGYTLLALLLIGAPHLFGWTLSLLLPVRQRGEASLQQN
jgi:hypothetical protein